MSDNGYDDSYPANNLCVGLSSEALAHLQIQWEQTSNCIHHFKNSKNASDHRQLVDQLMRVRNTLVVLEKPALGLVVRELLAVLDSDIVSRSNDDAAVAQLLESADRGVGDHLLSMQANVSLDNVLSLVPLINDCRAFREDMFISDSLMLAAGVPLPESRPLGVADESWTLQRKIWIDYALTRTETLQKRVVHFWQSELLSVDPLVRELDRMAAFTALHAHLRTLTPLFQSASVVASALQQQQLDDGPAIRALYSQLTNTVRRCSSVASPDDLVSGDLLRSFLYYLAQTKSESDTASELVHRFRLDRVRQVAQATQTARTPTIGVMYHLTNSIRSEVTREVKPLRTWLDASDAKIPERAISARFRVRLGQLEPVLTVMGCSECVECLQAVMAQLQLLYAQPENGETVQASLSKLLLQFDKLLDQSARRSLLATAKTANARLPDEDVFIDMATDACLREVSDDLQRCADDLLPMLRTRIIDIDATENVIGVLNMADCALQVLPLPEVKPLIKSFVELLQELLKRTTTSSLHGAGDLIDEESARVDTQLVHDMLNTLFVSLDSYLGTVLDSQLAAGQFLTDAEEILQQLWPLVQSLSFAGVAATGVATQRTAESLSDELPLSEVGSLTLNIDEELLLESLTDEDHHTLDSTLQLASEHQCLHHLESLENAVRRALKPSADSETHLPNEQMLRALHSLTDCAQSIKAAEVVAIVQPLQRTSLDLHRQGRHYNAEQTRIIGDLLLALRARLISISDNTPLSSSVLESGKLLEVLLSKVESGLRLPGDKSVSESALTISAQVSSLNDVFTHEATLLLDQLRDITKRQPFDASSVNSSFALLHTLKGSARVAGRELISECAHSVENEVLLLKTTDEQLDAIKQGCLLLQDSLSANNTARSLADKSIVDSVQTQVIETDVEQQIRDAQLSAPDLLELASELTSNQAQLTDELKRIESVCEDIQSGATRWHELRENGELPEFPEVNELLVDMEASRQALLGTLQRAQQQHLQSAQLGASLRHVLVSSQLVRVDYIRDRLIDTINDTAAHCEVSARLQLTGGDLMIDKRIYKGLVAPLEHLARNAVVHGIESSEERKRCGKAGTGLISLDISMDGTELVLRFSDDGRGVSPLVVEALQSDSDFAAEPAGSEIQALLFSTGFSSLAESNVIAGHGLGLPAVKTMVEQMKGQINLDADYSQGFSILMRIPQQLVVSQVILVQCDERFYGIPVAQTRTVQLPDDEDDRAPQTATSNATSIALQTLLGKPESARVKISGLSNPSVWVDVAGESLSIEVDKVVGYREVLVQNLGPQLESLNRFSAGGVLSDGQQVLIVDLSALVSLSDSGQSTSLSATRASYRPTAMVVDDSPTTRSMAKSLLQSCGIYVRTCGHALEALECLSEQLPQIMIVDLEMPKMDGFTLMRRVIERYGNMAPPFVIVSSRDNKPNREMARSLGAAMFLAKPYTDKRLQEAVQAAGLRLPDLTIA